MITVFGQIPDLFCAIYRHLKKKIERNFIQEKKYPPEKKQLSWFRCKTFFYFSVRETCVVWVGGKWNIWITIWPWSRSLWFLFFISDFHSSASVVCRIDFITSVWVLLGCHEISVT